MEWYWWILITVAVVVIGYFKLKVFVKLMSKKKEPEED